MPAQLMPWEAFHCWRHRLWERPQTISHLVPSTSGSDMPFQWKQWCFRSVDLYESKAPVNPGVEDSSVKGFQRGGGDSYVTCLMTLGVRCFQECMLLGSCSDLHHISGGVRECSLPGATSPISLQEWTTGFLKQRISGGGIKHSWILADETFSEGHDIGWPWDPGIGVCLRGAKCFSLEMTQEARTGWCCSVASWVGKQSSLLGQTLSGLQSPLGLEGAHMGPVSCCP